MKEIKYQMACSAAKGGASFTTTVEQYTQDMSGSQLVGGDSQLISHTAWTAVTFGGISGAPKFFRVKNCDGTNYVQFALANDGTQIFADLAAGQCDKYSLHSGTLYAKANTADVVIEKWAAEA